MSEEGSQTKICCLACWINAAFCVFGKWASAAPCYYLTHLAFPSRPFKFVFNMFCNSFANISDIPTPFILRNSNTLVLSGRCALCPLNYATVWCKTIEWGTKHQFFVEVFKIAKDLHFQLYPYKNQVAVKDAERAWGVGVGWTGQWESGDELMFRECTRIWQAT